MNERARLRKLSSTAPSRTRNIAAGVEHTASRFKKWYGTFSVNFLIQRAPKNEQSVTKGTILLSLDRTIDALSKGYSPRRALFQCIGILEKSTSEDEGKIVGEAELEDLRMLINSYGKQKEEFTLRSLLLLFEMFFSHTSRLKTGLVEFRRILRERRDDV